MFFRTVSNCNLFFVVVLLLLLLFPLFAYFLQERQEEKSNASKDFSRERAHEGGGGLFLSKRETSDGFLKAGFIQAHCFRRKSRSQTKIKTLLPLERERERERERGFEGEDDALG